MLTTGLVLDTRYRDHTNPPGHPERIERLNTLLELIREYQREGLHRLDPRHAAVEELAFVHDRDYIASVEATSHKQFHVFDADTTTNSKSYDTARLAAGGLLEIVERVMTRELDNGFAMVRPPGHHAERATAMGFCFFNNVAIAAEHLKRRHGLKRILIMDYDVHHGNGTQNSFYSDPDVLYISTHEHPQYPGTGMVRETGAGRGEGRTVNIPMPSGCGNEVYMHAFRNIIDPIARRFEPEFVLISAGFDCHYRDPLGGMMVNEEGVAAMTRMLLRIARDCSGGRCAVVLEGGYDLIGLKHSAAAVLDELGGANLDLEVPEGSDPLRVLEEATAVQKQVWKL